jgi:hypothetical protein
MSKATGSVGFEADGKRWTLCYSVNALCEMEDALGKSVAEIGATLSDATKAGAKFMRAVFWAGLTDHHPDLTIKDAGALMQGIGGITRATALFSEAFALAFPEVENVPLDSGKAKPSGRRAPTGDQP